MCAYINKAWLKYLNLVSRSSWLDEEISCSSYCVCVCFETNTQKQNTSFLTATLGIWLVRTWLQPQSLLKQAFFFPAQIFVTSLISSFRDHTSLLQISHSTIQSTSYGLIYKQHLTAGKRWVMGCHLPFLSPRILVHLLIFLLWIITLEPAAHFLILAKIFTNVLVFLSDASLGGGGLCLLEITLHISMEKIVWLSLTPKVLKWKCPWFQSSFKSQAIWCVVTTGRPAEGCGWGKCASIKQIIRSGWQFIGIQMSFTIDFEMSHLHPHWCLWFP